MREQIAPLVLAAGIKENNTENGYGSFSVSLPFYRKKCCIRKINIESSLQNVDTVIVKVNT